MIYLITVRLKKDNEFWDKFQIVTILNVGISMVTTKVTTKITKKLQKCYKKACLM